MSKEGDQHKPKRPRRRSSKVVMASMGENGTRTPPTTSQPTTVTVNQAGVEATNARQTTSPASEIPANNSPWLFSQAALHELPTTNGSQIHGQSSTLPTEEPNERNEANTASVNFTVQPARSFSASLLDERPSTSAGQVERNTPSAAVIEKYKFLKALADTDDDSEQTSVESYDFLEGTRLVTSLENITLGSSEENLLVSKDDLKELFRQTPK